MESEAPTNLLTRAVAGVILVFLADAAQLLLLVPDRTGELWAWEIQPEMTAMVLAAAYVGGGYFFARVLFGAPWHRVAAGFPPVIVFVWMAAIATFLHFDRFIEENLAFVAWIALYTVTPFAIPLLYLYDRRQAGRHDGGPPLDPGLRRAFAAVGGAIVLVTFAMLAAPQPFIDIWPWTLTPLTARIVAAVLAMFGSVWVSVALQGTRAGAKIPLQAHAIGLTVLVLAMLVRNDQVDWGNPLGRGIPAVAAAMAAVSALSARRAA